MQQYCCDKHGLLWDLLSSCVWSVVCVLMSYEHILSYFDNIKFIFLPVCSSLCTRVAYHPVLHICLCLNL